MADTNRYKQLREAAGFFAGLDGVVVSPEAAAELQNIAKNGKTMPYDDLTLPDYETEARPE
jgi:orotidine-5'-phosphate decarboxylase